MAVIDPLVIVLPNTAYGLNSLTDLEELSAHRALPLSEALATTWDYDAHFALYTLPGNEAWPRLNKSALKDLVEVNETPRLSITALDWDTPGHQELTPSDWDLLQEQLKDSSLPPPTYLYPTAHGARLIYTHPSLDPLEAEEVHQGFVELYRSQGILLDPTVWQWNRLHRLPNVLRDNVPQRPRIQTSPPLRSLHSIPRRPPLSTSPSPQTLRAPRPSDEIALQLAWEMGHNSRPKLTPWGKEAKRRLQGRMDSQLDEIFKSQNPPPIPPHKRNTTLMAWAGCMCNILENTPGTSPEGIYGLLIPTIAASLTPDLKSRDLFQETWKAVCYCWAHQQAQSQSNNVQQLTLADRLAQAILQWPCPPPDFPSNRDQQIQWLSGRLVVAVGTDYYVMERSGRYRTWPVKRPSLVSALKDSGIMGPAGLIPATRQTVRGEVDISDAYVLNHHSFPAQSVRGQPGEREAWLEGTTLVRGLYHRRTDLTPTHNPDVEEWLHGLFGAHYERAIRWIGLALAIERGPICALSLAGPPGVGKRMFCQGLAECINTESFASADVFGAWQYAMDESPFIVVNEAWPERGNSAVDGTFRALIGGDPFVVNRKHQALERISTNPRVILTANNRDVVGALFKRKDMTLMDQEAVAQRLFHIDLDNTAAQWLEKKGALSYTNGWIADPARGEPSRYTVARHFLHLYERFGQSGGATRFLMQNETSPAVIWSLTAMAGISPEVGETLVRMFEAGKISDEGTVTAHEALEFHRLHIREDTGTRFDLVSIGRAIRPFRKVTGELDLGRLLVFARETGLGSQRLEEMA